MGVSALGVSILGVSAPRECLLWGVSAPGEMMNAPRDGVSAMGDGGVCSQGGNVC